MKIIFLLFISLLPYTVWGGVGKPLPNITRAIDKLPRSQNNALPAPQNTVLQPVKKQEVKQPIAAQKQNSIIKDQTKPVSRNNTWTLPVIILLFMIIIIFFIKFNKKKTDTGLSLLELLMSIVIILVIVMTFLMVFPVGMRLNATNLRNNKGMEIANGIIEEIKNMPLCNQGSLCPGDFNTDGAIQSLECLSTNWANKGTNYWRPSSLPESNFFTISASDGIALSFRNSQKTTIGLAMPCDAISNYLITTTVKVQWVDTKTSQQKTSTAMSYFNNK